ncbi:MSHA biogenesis protein MshJ [hydrothermal vent metagenome]|uniref:MSHA biogenesis protein MshJ n=1 Tax=hydrothermal vent metagenome TaxID=652676 RepID=A0A3B1B818_9ZZZZ
MKARIQQLAERFDALSLRERALVLLAVLVVMYMLWDAVLMSPEHVRQKQLVGQMYQLNERMVTVDTQLQTLTVSLGDSEVHRQRQRIVELREALRGLASQQAALTVEFIRPQQMAGVLRDMLGVDGKLTLLKLESLGVQPLFPLPENENEPAAAAEKYAQPGIYKHGMQVIFEGDYFATLQYLQVLESMPWRFYWDELDYRVEDYPRARVSITIHTLSLEEGWIGV